MSDLDGLVAQYNLSKSDPDLQRQCNNDLFLTLTKQVTSFDDAAPYFDLTSPEIEEIRSNKGTEKSRRREMLEKWRNKNGSGATYLNIVNIFMCMENRQLAEIVLQHFKNLMETENNSLEVIPTSKRLKVDSQDYRETSSTETSSSQEFAYIKETLQEGDEQLLLSRTILLDGTEKSLDDTSTLDFMSGCSAADVSVGSLNWPPDSTSVQSYGDDCNTTVVLSFPKEKIRKYQHELAQPGINGENYIVCAPTGSGKTLVAALIIENHFKIKERNVKVLFVVKTQQLAHQQKDKLSDYISGIRVIDITGGSESPLYVTLPKVDVVVCTSGKLRTELKGENMHIADCSLLVLDECHHTVGVDAYAEIMEYYLLEKHANKKVPQVVGFTASPGVGRGRNPDLHKAIKHQYMLCARIDSTSGIKKVQENVVELMSFVPVPNHEVRTLSPRNPTEEFIAVLSNAMRFLEKMIDLQVPGPFEKSSGAYLKWVEGEREVAEMSGMCDQRDKISVLEYLKQYVLARMTYEDFEKENALDVLSQVPVYSEETAEVTRIERELEKCHKLVFETLSKLPKQPNQLLLEAEQLLHEHFKSKPNSRAIFFVRSIVHTKYITEWINKSHMLKKIIRPSEITGHSQKGFTKEEQIRVIEGFRNGEFNLLASTSVLEEGLDVPDCNLVIRFQLLSDEIAAVQAQGRARACDSMIHTVIQSDSIMNYNHLLNDAKLELASQAVLHLSASNINKDYLLELQRSVLFRREERLKTERGRPKTWNAEDVMLHCIKCNAEACLATDVCKYGTDISEPHYIVPSQKFIREKMKKIARKRPATGPQFEMQRPFKIACIECVEEWGVWACWKSACVQFPTLKCKSFKFKNTKTGAVERGHQWKRVPFEVQFFEDYEAQDIAD